MLADYAFCHKASNHSALFFYHYGTSETAAFDLASFNEENFALLENKKPLELSQLALFFKTNAEVEWLMRREFLIEYSS